MNISKVEVQISGSDILSIIEEYVKVEGLKIEKVSINEFVDICGSYTKGITIPFKATLAFGNVYENKLSLKVTSAKVYKIGIAGFIRNFAIKKSIKSLKQSGLDIKDGSVIIDLNIILKAVPFVDFELKSINLVGNFVQAVAENIKISMNKQTESIAIEDAVILEEKCDEENINFKDIEKVKDGYTKARECVETKVSDKYQPAFKWAAVIPDIVALIFRLFKDKRVKIKTKAAVSISLAYLASPIDILPDKIPFIGKIDDFAVAFFALNKIIGEVPLQVVLENWEGENDIILVLREGLKYLSKFTGGTNVDKLYSAIEKLALE